MEPTWQTADGAVAVQSNLFTEESEDAPQPLTSREPSTASTQSTKPKLSGETRSCGGKCGTVRSRCSCSRRRFGGRFLWVWR